jgi:hypothetical protein
MGIIPTSRNPSRLEPLSDSQSLEARKYGTTEEYSSIWAGSASRCLIMIIFMSFLFGSYNNNNNNIFDIILK